LSIVKSGGTAKTATCAQKTLDLRRSQKARACARQIVVKKLEKEFIAKVQKARRVVIPKVICELLGIKEGDVVKVKIERAEMGKVEE